MKSQWSVGLCLAGAVVLGTVIAGVIWSGVDELSIADGRGPLVVTWWRLDLPTLFAVAAAVFGTLFMFPSSRRARGDGEDLREVARELGLELEEGPVEAHSDRRPGVPLFEHWANCENRFSGTVDSVAVTMFDLTTIDRTKEDASRSVWTVIQFSESRLPAFVVVPRSWKTLVQRATVSPISFDPREEDVMTRQTVAAFEKAYVLGLRDTEAGSAEDAVRRLFCAPRLEAVVQHPRWHIQSADGFLICAVDGIAPAANRPSLWNEAVELRRALLEPVSDAIVPIPAAAGMDVPRQRHRSFGRRAGGIAGVVIGFFGGFIAFSTFMTSRIGPHAPGAPPAAGARIIFAFPAIVISSLVVCGIVGSWLGGRVADLRYRPNPDGAPAPKVGKGWVVAIAVLGWIVGGAIGMGLTVLVTKTLRTMWLVPILFFTPPVLGLVLGGFAGLGIARRRAAQRAVK